MSSDCFSLGCSSKPDKNKFPFVTSYFISCLHFLFDESWCNNSHKMWKSARYIREVMLS